MVSRIVQPALAFVRKDFFDALRSRRLLAVSIVLGALLVGTSAVLAYQMVSLPDLDGEDPGIPDPVEVWHRSGDGVLAGVAFGLVPLLLPFLPIAVAGRSMQKEKKRGIFQLSLVKPVPSWGPALGKTAGLYGALAIPTAAISLACGLAIQAVSGNALDAGLLTSFTLGNLLLLALYLLLTLVVGALLAAENVFPVVFLVWLGFNLIRSTGFFIGFRLATILGADAATTFQMAWSDLATFTGLYQAYLSPAVPAGLAFVVPPPAGGSLSLAHTLVPWASLIWVGATFALYAMFLRRIPGR